jgi:hypothetical protein
VIAWIRHRRSPRLVETDVGRPSNEPAQPGAPRSGLDSDTDLRAALHAAYIETSKTKLNRTSAAATFVTTAAGAVGTIYTGLLALVYSVASTPPRPLPARGLAPAIFLALAFFFSVVNVGFIRRSGARSHVLPPATTWEEQELRLVNFMLWIDRGALRRAWAMRIAVVCLGAAVALMPIPFVGLSRTATALAIGTTAAFAFVYTAYEAIIALVHGQSSNQPRGNGQSAVEAKSQ